MSSPKEITRLLADWGRGDRDALDQLTPLVHAELRRIAGRHMRREQPGHTLQPTALVSEVFVRLAGQEQVQWQDRAHFFAFCARMMRNILVDHARAHARDKRGGGAVHVSLSEAATLAAGRQPDLIALSDALERLEKLDPQKGRIIELRFFAGLTLEETAGILGVSQTTVRREWRRSKAWLFRAMSAGGAL